MGERNRAYTQQQSSTRSKETEAEVDVDAEHDPAVARRASLAALRREQLRYASKAAIPPAQEGLSQPGPTISGHLTAPSAQISTGQPLVDKGLGCTDKPMGTEGCFLSPARRGLLLAECHGRILRAEIHFTSALNQIRVDELLKKEPEKSALLMELLIDVIGHVGVSTVLKAFAALKGGAIEGVQQYVENANELPAAMSAESSGHLTTALSMAAGLGKKTATTELGPQTDPTKPEEGTQKASNVAYLSYLESRAGTIYQYISEDMIAGLSDSLLLTLTEAFDTKHHSVEVYKQELSGKLKRFDGSGVRKLGVTKNESFDLISDGTWLHDTRAFWVKSPLGRRLGLYQRAYQPIPDTVMTDHFTRRRDATPFDRVAMEMQDYAQRPFTFVRYVPLEFEAAAVAMHTAKWHAEPVERVAQTPEEIASAGVTI